MDWSFEATSAPTEVTRQEKLRDFWDEFIYKPGLVAWSDWRTRIGALIVLFYVLMGTVGVALYRAPESRQVAESYAQPFQNTAYILGSDYIGHDILAQVIHATPDMLLMVLAGAVWATGLALVIGTVAGYKGGTVDRAIMSVTDVVMSIPGLPMVMVIAFALNPKSPILIGVIININYWAGLGRTIRSQVLTIREEEYVEASRTMGMSTWRIVLKDIVPNLMPYVTINFVLAARYVIFASVGLYFLGVLPPTVGNWGYMLQLAEDNGGLLVPEAAHWIIVPMITIMGFALGLMLLSQGLDQVFNPRVRTRMAGESESTVEEDAGGTSTELM